MAPPAAVLNPAHRGMPAAKPRMEPASAVHRAAAGLRSEPSASTATPKAIGSHVTSERIGKPCGMVCS